MHKLLVISDTHGRVDNIRALLNIEKDFDSIIHLGDVPDDAEFIKSLTNKPVINVAGNCGLSCGAPEELVIEMDGAKLFLTHGHRYSVKRTLLNLKYRAEELEVRAALFGHTHIRYCAGEPMLFNPGALKDGEYGILEIDNGSIKSCFKNL